MHIFHKIKSFGCVTKLNEVFYTHPVTYLLLKQDRFVSELFTLSLGRWVCDTPLNSCLNIHGTMKQVLEKEFLNLKLSGVEGRKSRVYVQCFIMEKQYRPL